MGSVMGPAEISCWNSQAADLHIGLTSEQLCSEPAAGDRGVCHIRGRGYYGVSGTTPGRPSEHQPANNDKRAEEVPVLLPY